FYLLRNTTDRPITRKVSFRQHNKRAELWDPITGDIIPIPIAEANTVHSRILLTLAPHASYFVAFTNGPAASSKSLSDEDREIVYTLGGYYFPTDNDRQTTLEGPWTLTFPPNLGAHDSITLPSLISWSESEVPDVRYFTGMATYHKE